MPHFCCHLKRYRQEERARGMSKTGEAGYPEDANNIDDNADLEDEMDIEILLNEALPPEEEDAEDDDQELEEEAIERITETMREDFESEESAQDELIEALNELRIPVKRVDAGASIIVVRHRLIKVSFSPLVVPD
ncbi:unnamed protein product [Protopolystoma xenopodis]|uniref:Uncharacterized protein n=1 Tax=Protopolystoma xenopodis TaxID=117903 RepID=A0A3S5CUL7_9PLAT|nr:unnamed protein product [Protopolystoma xenopodis]